MSTPLRCSRENGSPTISRFAWECSPPRLHEAVDSHRAGRQGPSWEWIEVLVLCVAMQPVIWCWARWLRRRKLAEFEEVKGILNEMKE